MQAGGKGGSRDTALAVLACAAIVGFGAWRLIVALKTGVLDAKFHDISRADHPALFWFTFGFFALALAGLGAMVVVVCAARLLGKRQGPPER